MTKLIFNCKLLLKLRSPTLCLSIGTYAQQLFYVIQVSTHTEDECPLSIIFCPYARMGYQTKVSKNNVVDVKSKVLHGCFQNK